MLVRTKWTIIILIACGLLAGCASSDVFNPSGSGSDPDPRISSGTQIEIHGNDFYLEHGTSNRPGEKALLGRIIAPGGDDDLAWAHYQETGLIYSRPVFLSVDVDSVIAPGGDDDLPLLFWVGIADYTENKWEWHGPFTDDTSFELNSKDDRERYVTADYIMNFIVLTDCHEVQPSTGNPDGLSAVEIVSSTLTTELITAGSYFATRPHFTSIDIASVGDGDVTLEWTHIIDLGDAKMEANNYTVYRRKAGEEELEKIALLVAPASSFNDPGDAIPAKEDPVPGETYYYFLEPSNTPGGSTMSASGPITIPLE